MVRIVLIIGGPLDGVVGDTKRVDDGRPHGDTPRGGCVHPPRAPELRAMTDSPLAAHAATPSELKQRLEAEELGEPFLVLRDANGTQMLVSLEGRSTVTIG